MKNARRLIAKVKATFGGEKRVKGCDKNCNKRVVLGDISRFFEPEERQSPPKAA